MKITQKYINRLHGEFIVRGRRRRNGKSICRLSAKRALKSLIRRVTKNDEN